MKYLEEGLIWLRSKAEQIGAFVWKRLAYEWSIANSLEAKAKIVLVVVLVFWLFWGTITGIVGSIFIGKANAAELGPHPDVTFLYGAPGLTIIDEKTDPTAILGVRHSWHPVDLVGEINTQGIVNLMLAKGVGDVRVLGGIGLKSGIDNSALVFGIDYNRFLVRINTYTKTTSTTVPGITESRRYRRRRPPAPPVTTNTSSGHTAFMVGYVFPLNAK